MEEYVWVRRQSNDGFKAKYRLSDFTGAHWDNMSGGVYKIELQSFIYGYVNCQGMLEGEVSHSGIHGSCPHSIKVCALKKDNIPEVFDKLKSMSGTRPEYVRSTPTTGKWCKTDVLGILADGEARISSDLIFKLEEIEHHENNIRAVLKKLARAGKIICEKYPNDKKYNQFRIVKK